MRINILAESSSPFTWKIAFFCMVFLVPLTKNYQMSHYTWSAWDTGYLKGGICLFCLFFSVLRIALVPNVRLRNPQQLNLWGQFWGDWGYKQCSIVGSGGHRTCLDPRQSSCLSFLCFGITDRFQHILFCPLLTSLAHFIFQCWQIQESSARSASSDSYDFWQGRALRIGFLCV